jgi:N-terminal domain of reverse transcriptase
MTDAQQHTEGWEMLPWKQFERTIFRLQKRIYKATQRGDFKQVRNPYEGRLYNGCCFARIQREI